MTHSTVTVISNQPAHDGSEERHPEHASPEEEDPVSEDEPEQQQQQEEESTPAENNPETETSSDTTQNDNNNNDQEEEEIYYFGFGPIVNPMVRHRRNINTKSIRAAYLYDYRLTFHFGSNASILKKIGYEVHGLLMTLASPEDWKRCKEYDVGNVPTLHQVIPYDEPDRPVSAYLFEMSDHVDDATLDGPMERLPQERYLKLIAQGLRKHGVDEEYIEYQILAVPYVPNRKPDDYIKIEEKTTPLPSWGWTRYKSKCDKANRDVYFVLGQFIIQLNASDPEHPLAKWFSLHGHGKGDCTLAIHKTAVDPDIPTVDEEDDITPLHRAWAENQCCEILEQYGMSSSKVAILVEDGHNEDEDNDNDEAEETSSIVSTLCCDLFRSRNRRTS